MTPSGKKPEFIRTVSIKDYIQQDVFAKRASERGCLVIYDPSRRFRDLALGLNTSTCRVLDAGTSIIEQRENAMQAFGDLASGKLHQLIVWTPLRKPESDEDAQTDPFSALSRSGTFFPHGDEDEYRSICRRAKPDHLTEIEKLFAEGDPAFATVDALDEGGSWPQLKSLLNANSAKEIILGLLAPKPEQEVALKDNPGWATEAREFIERTLGHKLRTKGQTRTTIAEELWRLLLFSEFVFDSEGGLPASLASVPIAATSARGLVFDICDDLRKHQDFRTAYISNADSIEEALALPERASAMTNLGLRDKTAAPVSSPQPAVATPPPAPNTPEVSTPVVLASVALKERHYRIHFGATGYSYETIFGEYLVGAEEIPLRSFFAPGGRNFVPC